MYNKILVPLDGSNEAEMALPYAEELSSAMEAEIILVSVSGPTSDTRDHLFSYYLAGLLERIQKKEALQGIQRKRSIKTEVLFGKPADEILRYEDEAKADLLVMASRGRSGIGPWLLGNIAAKVLRATEKPLLLVRRPPEDSSPRQKRLIEKILAPLDGSRLGETALNHAEAIGENLGAEIVLFHVLEPPRPLDREDALATRKLHFRLKEETEKRKSAAEEYLRVAGTPLREKGFRVETTVLPGSAAETIIDYSEEASIDLVAMSSHGRSGIGRWVFGSVTDKVVHAGDMPVLVVRASEQGT